MTDVASPLRIMITAKEEPDDQPYTQIWDIRTRLQSLLLGFGNGVWDEMRVVGESEEALNTFRTILHRGGYRMGEEPMAGVTLMQQGDEIWAGFVFIDPHPKPLEE